MEGLSPFNHEKTPSFYGQRPEGLLPLLLLRQARRHLRLRDGDRRAARSREAVERLAGMAGVPLPKPSPRGRGARGAPPDAARRHRSGGAILRGDACRRGPAPSARAYLADRGIAPAIAADFRLGYAPAERFALKEHLGAAGIPRRGHDRGRPADLRRRHPGPLRSLPRPGDLPDRRLSRPGHRLRRPRARRRAAEIPELAGDAALPQGRCSTTSHGARAAAHEGGR